MHWRKLPWAGAGILIAGLIGLAIYQFRDGPVETIADFDAVRASVVRIRSEYRLNGTLPAREIDEGELDNAIRHGSASPDGEWLTTELLDRILRFKKNGEPSKIDIFVTAEGTGFVAARGDRDSQTDPEWAYLATHRDVVYPEAGAVERLYAKALRGVAESDLAALGTAIAAMLKSTHFSEQAQTRLVEHLSYKYVQYLQANGEDDRGQIPPHRVAAVSSYSRDETLSIAGAECILITPFGQENEVVLLRIYAGLIPLELAGSLGGSGVEVGVDLSVLGFPDEEGLRIKRDWPASLKSSWEKRRVTKMPGGFGPAVLEMDLAVSPGHLGAPVLNAGGQVIGLAGKDGGVVPIGEIHKALRAGK